MKKKNDDEQYQDDVELTEEYEENEDEASFIKKYSTALIVAAVAVVAIVGGYFYMSSTAEQEQAEASLALSRIMPVYLSNNYNQALYADSLPPVRGEQVTGLIKIVDMYESTDQGKYAALYAGNSLLSLQRYDEAEKYFNIAAKSEYDIVLAGANSGIAACYEYQEKFDEAAKSYQEAAENISEKSAKSRYLYYAALCYEKSGNKELAGKLFDKIIDLDVAQFSVPSKSAMIRLGMKIE